MISAIANSGANPELSIAFTVRNPAKVSEELLESAALNARAKAEILCRASGSEMGQLKAGLDGVAQTVLGSLVNHIERLMHCHVGERLAVGTSGGKA